MDGIGYPNQWQPVRSNCRVPSGPMAFSSTCSDCFTCETCSVTMKVDGMGKRHEWKEQMNGSTHRGKTCYIGISMLIYVLSIRLKVHWNLGNSSNTAATIPGSKRLLKYQWLRTWRGWSQVVTIHPKSASLWNEHGSYSNCWLPSKWRIPAKSCKHTNILRIINEAVLPPSFHRFIVLYCCTMMYNDLHGSSIPRFANHSSFDACFAKLFAS